MAKKKVGTKKTTASAAKTESKPSASDNPITTIAKTISFGVVLIALSFLIFGGASDIVYSIPIAMGLILLGIVLGLLANRRVKE